MAGDFSFHGQASVRSRSRAEGPKPSDFPEPRTCVYSARLFQPFIRLLDRTSLIPAEWAQAMRSLDLDERMPAATAHQLLDCVLSLGVPVDIGLHAAREWSPGDGGALDYAVTSAATVRDAIEAAGRYMRLVNDAVSIDLEIVAELIAPLAKPRPVTLIGSGKVAEIAAVVEEGDADLVVVNAQLAPIQQRNLERAWKAKVLDRTGLILEIFGRRASTKEGTLQVELAHLNYQKGRLVRSWTHLERQRGGDGPRVRSVPRKAYVCREDQRGEGGAREQRLDGPGEPGAQAIGEGQSDEET